MKKRSLLAMALAVVMCFSLAGCGDKDNQEQQQGNNDTKVEDVRLLFASGGTGGTYYPYAGAVATVWGEKVPGVSANVQSTGGSSENLSLIDKKDVDVAIVQNDVMLYANKGTEIFDGKAPLTNFSTMATVYSEVCQIVVNADSGIKTVADLKGKRVSVGDIGSGVEVNAKQILGAAGLTFDDIKVEHLGFTPSADAMKDGKIDAFFLTAGIPTTAVTELATTKDIDIVALDQATIDKLIADYPFYAKYTISKDAYNGLKEDKDVIAVKATLIVNNELSEDLVYNLTKALFDGKEDIAKAHAKGNELDVKAAQEGVSVPLHPGAAKYFNEVNAQ